MPKDDEWTALSDYLGGIDGAGTKMKSTSGWSENGNGTNESGFSGLPGGDRSSNGSFSGLGYYGGWWSSTEDDTANARYRSLLYAIDPVDRDGSDKQNGFSVRCLRD